jgi:uncharacterized membrane protein YidH (DUF202 family)
MILEEEFDEAVNDSTGWGMGTVFGWAITAFFGATAVEHESSGFSVAAICCLVLSTVCAVGYLRCRRTVKAWRDQKRLEMAQRYVEKMGGER